MVTRVVIDVTDSDSFSWHFEEDYEVVRLILLKENLGDARRFLWGDSSKDFFKGAAGNDNLIGGEGNDILIGGAGEDILDGGTGRDFIRYTTATSRVIVDLADTSLNSGDAWGDTFVNISNIRGSNFDDILNGDSESNEYKGGRGDDILRGRDGRDWLRGEQGNDSLFGGDGNDVLDGGAGADLLDGGSGRNSAQYVSATFGVKVDLADTSVNTGDAGGDTFVNISSIRGSEFNDIINGNSENQELVGGRGDDILRGRDGRDWLRGEQGNDSLFGGDGNDVLNGGTGNDTLTGGEGEDRFVFTHGDAADMITDFEDGMDIIKIGGSVTFDDLEIIDTDGGVEISYGVGSSIFLSDFVSTDLTQQDFIFV